MLMNLTKISASAKLGLACNAIAYYVAIDKLKKIVYKINNKIMSYSKYEKVNFVS